MGTQVHASVPAKRGSADARRRKTASAGVLVGTSFLLGGVRRCTRIGAGSRDHRRTPCGQDITFVRHSKSDTHDRYMMLATTRRCLQTVHQIHGGVERRYSPPSFSKVKMSEHNFYSYLTQDSREIVCRKAPDVQYRKGTNQLHYCAVLCCAVSCNGFHGGL